jgi:hypothetical protein
VKRVLLVLAAAVLFVSSNAVVNFGQTDGGGGSTSCGQTLCKP